MRYSIVIPTLDRPQQLRACLEGVAAQELPAAEFETIVVDDGSRVPVTDALPDAVERARARVIRQPNAGPGAARNRAAAEARGELLAFLDDDCVPAPEWLATLGREAAAHPGAGLGGRTVNTLTRNAYSRTSQTLIDYLYEYYNTGEADPMFTTNNLALPRREFQRIGGFDTRFTRAGGEDRELCLRWVRSGGRLRYVPQAVVFHFHRLGLGSFLKLHFTYGRGAAQFHQIRGSPPVPEPLSFYRDLLLYPWRERLRGRAGMSLLLAMCQVANAAGYVWERRAT
ncbi:MAG TPA: glycosyltransferase [Gemmatimonadota bacterium]|nr:glycosyltransferase [Gemmatimonadota bacterium]